MIFLFENFPPIFLIKKFLIDNLLTKFFVILKFFSLEKKFSIASICVSPIPFRSAKFFKIFPRFLKSNNFENSSIVKKMQLKFLHFLDLCV